MRSETFTANTMGECKKLRDRWLKVHEGVIVKREYAPPEMQDPAGRFAPIADGKTSRISLCIEYEDSN